MKNKELLIFIGGIVVLAVIILVVFLVSQQAQIKKVNIITDKTDYKIEDALKVKIKNDLKESICFSSCYPYYLEKKDGQWKSYRYVACEANNLVERCVEPKQVKAFELILPFIEAGFHRLAIPACVGCSVQDLFKEDKRFYSNEFIINE